MAKVSLVRAAEWAMQFPDGVTARDFQEHFHMERLQANVLVHNLRNRDKYVVEWVPGSGAPRSRDRVLGRLKVLGTRPRPIKGDGYGPIVGVYIGDAPAGVPTTLHYASGYAAELTGGFLRTCIYDCLRGAASRHGGYRWVTKADYDQRIQEGSVHKELLHSH